MACQLVLTRTTYFYGYTILSRAEFQPVERNCDNARYFNTVIVDDGWILGYKEYGMNPVDRPSMLLNE